MPLTPEQARQALRNLQSGTPWLAFGGIGAPFLGLFSATGALGTITNPDGPSLGQAFPLLPAGLKPPVPATNEAQFGYAVDSETSPGSLVAAHVHAGRLAAAGEPRGWDQAGEITPIRRYADMLAGYGVQGVDGSAWYHPLRLTIDSGAVAAGNANPAQDVLDLGAIHGHRLGRHLPIYAFGAALGGQRVLDAAAFLADQSGIPDRALTLVERASTYAHNDPASASPDRNEFLHHLLRFLSRNKLRSGSYFVGAVGGTPLPIVKPHSEQQNRPDASRHRDAPRHQAWQQHCPAPRGKTPRRSASSPPQGSLHHRAEARCTANESR
ncbi:hypothetical protein ACFQVC_28800 [Streptomyces monticola]|uniref:Uncharacterized protein n=1 Tax=Streptomyces monticola TaxID=2666263 RepID=A0ABW2JQP3_9ACTN